MKKIASLAFIAALVAAAPASAESVRFSFKSADLNSPASIASLYERLNDFAAASCGSQTRVTLSSLRAEKLCAERLIADLVANIDSPSLSQLHEEDHAARFADAGV